MHPLTEDIASVRQFVEKLVTLNGWDIAEDMAGGLKEALEMPLTAGTKRLILVADSPCHSEEYHSLPYGKYTTFDDAKFSREIAASPDIREQMRRMARQGIDMTFIEIVPALTSKMAKILEQEYERAAIMRNSGHEFRTISLAEPEAIARFADAVTTAACDSLSRSKQLNVLEGASKALDVSSVNHYGPSSDPRATLPTIAEDCAMDQVVDKAPRKPLEWSDLDDKPLHPVIRHTYHFRPGANVDLKHSTQETAIKVLRSCFASGAMRTAHAMYDEMLNKRFVAKVYFGGAASQPGTAASQRVLANDVKMQMVAKRLAVEFSCQSESQDGIDFFFTSWYELQDPVAAGLSASMAAFSAEPYIGGEYRKYNNNNGWTCGHASSASLATIAQAFSHFTWQRTFGQLMVVDLQGVGGIFADPQIHSMDTRAFWRGNLSEVGMVAFFSTHECNDVCEALRLEPCVVNVDSRRKSPRKTRGVKRKATPLEEQAMTCSCVLCGEILAMPRCQFVEAHARKREVYCDDCANKMNERTATACVICAAGTSFSGYWYDMKGMKPPTTCEKCKAVAGRTTCLRGESTSEL